MPLEAGQSLLHYRLIEKIGEGGMGVVWKAVDTTLDREVAIKVLPEAPAADPQRLERFEREARLLASLNHARIAAVYGLHQSPSTATGEAGVRFLAMELVDGEDLAERLARGPLTRKQALQVALQVAEGLEAAHASGIVHRDLKPGNIRLTADGDVKILDFGLAKALFGVLPGGEVDLTRSPTMTAATQAGVILGTAAYMSPEQSRGQEADRRTDIWAFGCVLYEMLTGKGVFHATTASDCIARILERDPDWEVLPPDTPRVVRRLLRRCLEKDQRHRLHDIADARIEIEDALAGRGVDAPAPAPSARPVESRLLWAAAGLVLGIAATGLVVSQWARPSATVSRSAARFSVSLPPDAPVVPSLGTVSVALSPDGTRLVYAGLDPSVDGSRQLVSGPGNQTAYVATQLYLRNLDDYTVRPIEGTRGATSPFFSPDGEWVAFRDRSGGQLKKIRLRGGVPVTLTEGTFRGGHWGQDGRIYFTSPVDGIQAIPEDGGAPETITVPDQERGEKTRRFPHLLPGGRGLLFTLGNATIGSYDEAAVGLLDLESGEHRVLFEGGTAPSYVPTGHIVYGRGGSLEAVPFDLDTLTVTGAPFTVAERVVIAEGWGEVQYTISASGTLAYLPGGPEIYSFDVYWLDREGRVEPVPLPRGNYSEAHFSPDGKWLAVNDLGANASVWIYGIERQTMTCLTTAGDNVSPVWMRNGTHVTYVSSWPGPLRLLRAAIDGSGEATSVHEFEVLGFLGSWNVGDERLLFTSDRPGTGLDIYALSPGQGVEPLVQTRFQEAEPVLSPDGQWLAYTSDASGVTELYVQRFPGGGSRWQVSVGGGERARWSPDGRELYYWKGGRLMAVSVTPGSEFVTGQERELPQPEFDVLLDWDVAPDGSRFVVVGRVAPDTTRTTRSNRVEATVPEIRVVTDWFDELRGLD